MKSTSIYAARLLWLVMLGLVCGLLMPRVANADFPLQPNDRVVFYGDSITEGRNYTRPFQDFVYARYPERQIRFFNAGWGGDTAPGGLNRLERDVLSLQPNVVTLCFGMNDGRYTQINDEILSTFWDGLDGTVKTLTEKGVRVIVFSPPPVDYDRRANLKDVDYNGNLAALGAAAAEVATKYGATYVDIMQPMMAANAALKVENPDFTMIPDAIHPNETGGLVMAGAMLQGLGAEPMPPLAVVPAAPMTGDESTQGTTQISVVGPVNVPLWMSDEGAMAAAASGFLSLAAQRLQVGGLPAGSYDLKINGKSAGMWSHSELAAGALIPGTYSTRARRLYDLTNWKEQNYFNLWRVLQLGEEQTDAIAGAVAGLKQADAGYHSAVESLSAPLSNLVITIESNGLPAGIGPNLALRKPYEVSDPNLFNYGIGGLTDGSWSGDGPHTFATGDQDVFPKTATIDLGKTAAVSNVLMGVPPFGSTKTVNVLLSTDGQNFTEVGSHVFTLKQEEKHPFSFAPTAARFVRLTYSDHYPDFNGFSPNFAFTREVEVYGPAQ